VPWCSGENCVGGVRRSVGELRMFSETSVAAALCVSGVEVPATGVPFEEPPLPEVRCAVRTVDGVAGE
jgi:hypothetical protein